MNRITELLDLEDSEITMSDTTIEGQTKFITLETAPSIHFCPICGFRMHSKGFHTHKINHPVLQDGYKIVLLLKQRRWKSSDLGCGYCINESFRFVDKSERNTNATDMIIINAFRNLDASALSNARKFKVSDTYALEIFDIYVKMDRLYKFLIGVKNVPLHEFLFPVRRFFSILTEISFASKLGQ